MADDIHLLLMALRNDVAPAIDVRDKVMHRLAELPVRPAVDPVMNWLLAVSVLAASVIWLAVLPGMMRTPESTRTYVGMIEALDVRSEFVVR